MIKMFEEYNLLYTKVDYNSFLYYFNSRIPFDKKEVILLEKKYYEVGYMGDVVIVKGSGEKNYYLSCEFDQDKKDLHHSIFRFIYKPKPLYFTKSSDEWYTLRCENDYYKCDQMEGLLKCLEDISI